MKEIIVTAIIICLLINAMPLSASVNETDINGDINSEELTGAISLESDLSNSPLNDGFSLKTLKPEYVPGEIIVKFKDNCEINFYTSSVDVQYFEDAKQTSTGETMTTTTEPLGYQQGTTNMGALEPLQSEEVIMTGFETLDNLNIAYGLVYTEKLIEDDSTPEFSNVYRLCFNDNIDVLGAVEEYSNDPNVEFAEPNYICYVCATPNSSGSTIKVLPKIPPKIPNDPYFGEQWALSKIHAPDAWNIETGDSNIVIAIFDSGVDYTHPDLTDNILRDANGNIIGYDFTNNDNDPLDDWGHGTACAGVAAAVTNNGIGIAGVCWNCKIMPIKTIGYKHTGIFEKARAFIYATNHGANVISCSWVLPLNRYSYLLHNAVEYAYQRNVVIVASAGNYNDDLKYYPAAYTHVIAVGASDENDKGVYIYDYWSTQYGSWIDVAAPGVNGYATSPTYESFKYHQDPEFWSLNYIDDFAGTSMACPYVAGVAALILSKNPYLTPLEVKTILRSSTDSITSERYIGVGRINAYTALQKVAHVVVELDNSLDDKEVKGDLEIVGTVSSSSYTVWYGRGTYPVSWTEIKDRNSNSLALWHTLQVEDGLYTIRLKAIINGLTYEDRAIVKVNNKVSTFYVDDDNTNGPFDGTPEHPFNTIQTAVNSCGSFFRDNVYVYNGTYYECVVIEEGRSVNLIGENKNNTTIDGYWITDMGFIDLGATILITLNGNADISGFTVGGGIIGIRVDSSNNFIYDNNLSDSCNTNIILTISARNNVIYHNDMIHKYYLSTMHAQDHGKKNIWYNDTLKEGNYWSDYKNRYPGANPSTLRPWIWDTPYSLLYLLPEDLIDIILMLFDIKDIYPLIESYDGSSGNNQQIIQNQQQNNMNQFNTLPENQQNSEMGSTTQSTTGSTTTNI